MATLPSSLYALLLPLFALPCSPGSALPPHVVCAETLSAYFTMMDDALMSLDDVLVSIERLVGGSDIQRISVFETARSALLLFIQACENRQFIDSENLVLAQSAAFSPEQELAEAKSRWANNSQSQNTLSWSPLNGLVNQLAAVNCSLEDNTRSSIMARNADVLLKPSRSPTHLISVMTPLMPHLYRVHTLLSDIDASIDQLVDPAQPMPTSVTDVLMDGYLTALHLDEDGWSHAAILDEIESWISSVQQMLEDISTSYLQNLNLPPITSTIFAIRRLLAEEEVCAVLDCAPQNINEVYNLLANSLSHYPEQQFQYYYLHFMTTLSQLATQNTTRQEILSQIQLELGTLVDAKGDNMDKVWQQLQICLGSNAT